MALPKAQEMVSSNALIIFSKTHCPYCRKTKDLFNQLGATYSVYELDIAGDGKEIQAALAEWTGQKTVPNVFIGGKHIGGCDTTMALHDDGKLVPLLTEAGALGNTSLTKAKEMVSSNPVMVFSKTHCPYCRRTKDLFNQLGATYTVYELDIESDGKKIQDALAEWTGQKTVPNVFIGGKHIGGCDATMALHKDGKLVPLLTEAGAIPKVASTKAKEMVSSNPVMIFSKTHCPYCIRTKDLLNHLGANYTVYELDIESDGKEIQTALAEWTGQKTVPNVFISGKHIGGCDATTSHHDNGKLVPLLIEAGALAKTSL